jgi:hypothetical protein
MSVEVDSVSLRNDFLVLCYPIHSGTVNQEEVWPLSSLHLYATDSYHIGKE